MTKEEFRKFLNVPDVLPYNYRVKLTEDLIRVCLFNTDGMGAFRTFLDNFNFADSGWGYSLDAFNNLKLKAQTFAFADRENPLIDIALDSTRPEHNLLMRLLYQFHSQTSIDRFLDSWWQSKKNFVSVLSTYPGWSMKNFALKVSGSSSNGIDYKTGTSLFQAILSPSGNHRVKGLYVPERHDDNFFSRFRVAIAEAYRIIVLDNMKIPSVKDALDDLPYQTLSGDMMSYKSQLIVQKHLEEFPVSSTVDGKYVDLFANTVGIKFNDLLSVFYYNCVFSSFNMCNPSMLPSTDLLLSALLVQIRANKPNLSKQVSVKKLLRYILELNYIRNRDYPRNLEDVFTHDYVSEVDKFANDPASSVYTYIRFKRRLTTGFDWTNHPEFQQAMQKCIECFSCKSVEQTFVINLHPVSQLFSSFMTEATSCHNLADLSSKKIGPISGLLGQYHRGQLQTAAAGGFLIGIYDKYPDDLLCFQQMSYRAQLFINPELDMIRQHLSYPARNNDELARAEAKTYRNIIHELLSPWHGGGTDIWYASKSNEMHSYSMSGFNWERVSLNKNNDTLLETKQGAYLGYNSESTFAFSHVKYDLPHDFVLPISKDVPSLTNSTVYPSAFNREGTNIHFWSYRRESAKPKPYESLDGSGVWNKPLVVGSWVLANDTIFVRYDKNIFHVTKDVPHYACSKCNHLFLGNGSICDACSVLSNSKLFSSMVGLSANPIYFDYKSDDDLHTFLTKASTKVKWKDSSSLVSFVPLGMKFLLVLKDGTLSIKVTKPKDNDNIIDVSSVVFE